MHDCIEVTPPQCSIIILNWNGRDLLANCLPSVFAACRVSRIRTEVIVVDNGSTDGSAAWVKSTHPAATVIELVENVGFGEGNNIGVQHARGEFVVLLNNDMVVEKNFLAPLIRGFQAEPDVFAVGAQIFFRDEQKRREETGKTFAFWDNGTIRFMHREIGEMDEERKFVPITWASGGAAAFDRKKFDRLGGFRALFSPAYYEDTDLSYRAWKRGWTVLLAVESKVYHEHRASTSKRFSSTQLETLVQRNQLLFIWANISEGGMLWRHFLTLKLRLLKQAMERKSLAGFIGFLQAVPRFAAARRLNHEDRRKQQRSDQAILASDEWRRGYLSRRNRLSILFVCPYLPCLGVHGGGARMFHLIQGLSKLHSVSVLSYIEHEDERKLAKPLEAFCATVTLMLRGQSPGEPDWFHIKPHRPVKEFANPLMKQALHAEVSSGKYDLIQFEYFDMAYLAADVKKYGVPMVFTNHEVQSRAMETLLRSGSHSFLDRIALRWEWMKMLNLERSVNCSFSKIVTFTREDADAVMRYQPSLPVNVHPLGVDARYFASRRGVKGKTPSLAFVGYFRHSPNEQAIQWFIANVWPTLKVRFEGLQLLLVGAEPPPSIRALHDGTSVTVTGRVNDLRPFLARATVFIAPLFFGAGMRGKILEAWAMKKPVVATPLALAGLEAEDGENALLANTAEEFIRCIGQVLGDRKLQKRLGEGGSKTVKRLYTWPKLIRSHNEIYREILGGKP